MASLPFDVANMLAGLLVLASLLMIYQVRLPPLLSILRVHGVVLSLAIGWQAHIQQAPELYITALLTLGMKAGLIPSGLQRIVKRLGIQREIESVTGIGLTMLVGIGLVALSLNVMLPATVHSDAVTREDIALALSVVLLGLLMMVTRRNAVSQIVAFLSLENGIDLAATAARGMPLLVEISVAFSLLVTLLVVAVFLFRIQEQFETVDMKALDQFRGERQ
jgi:hydrogenase-4 component E